MSVLDWYRERQLKKIEPKRPTSYKGWDQVRKIGIYYEVKPESEAEIEAWTALFQSQGKEVEVLAFQGLKRKNLDQSWKRLTICRDDINWWGMPNQQDYKTFEGKSIDVFLDLSIGDEAVHRIIGRSISAQIKVGFQSSKTDWADLIIDCENTRQSSRCREEVLALLKFINA